MPRDDFMIPELPEWANSIVSALGGGSVMAYIAHRRLKADKNSDNIDDKTQKLINSLHEALDHERQKNLRQEDAVDRLAKERNEAVKTAGKLETLVEMLQNQVKFLQSQVEELKQEVAGLKETNSELVRQFVLLREAQEGKP